MNEVNFENGNIIFRIIPPYFDDEMNKFNENWNEHLDWVKSSLKEIFKSEKQRLDKKIALLKTPSQKNKNKRRMTKNNKKICLNLNEKNFKENNKRLTRSQSKLLKQFNENDIRHKKNEKNCSESNNLMIKFLTEDMNMQVKNGINDLNKISTLIQEHESLHTNSNLNSCQVKKNIDFEENKLELDSIKSNEKVLTNKEDILNKKDIFSNISNVTEYNLKNNEEKVVEKKENKIENNLNKNNDVDNWITDDESFVTIKNKSQTRNSVSRKSSLKRNINFKSTPNLSNKKKSKSFKNLPSLVSNCSKSLSKLPIKINSAATKKQNPITNTINFKNPSNQINKSTNKDNESNLLHASSQASLKSNSSIKPAMRYFGDSTLKYKLEEEKKRKNLEQKLNRELEAKTKKDNFLKQKQEELKKKREERERRVREAQKLNALDKEKKIISNKKNNLLNNDKNLKIKQDKIENSNFDYMQKIELKDLKHELTDPLLNFKYKKQSLSSTFIKPNQQILNPQSYDISDLKSENEESEDEETTIKKAIPNWAKGINFLTSIKNQYSLPFKTRENQIKSFFVISNNVSLDEIFTNCNKQMNYNFLKRTSSAFWNSPPSTYINRTFSREI